MTSPVRKPDMECFLGKAVVVVVGREEVVVLLLLLLVEGGIVVVEEVSIVVVGRVEVVVILIEVVVLVLAMVDVVAGAAPHPEGYLKLRLSRYVSQFSIIIVKGRFGSKGELDSCVPSANLISK
jgi:hypothetical protein